MPSTELAFSLVGCVRNFGIRMHSELLFVVPNFSASTFPAKDDQKKLQVASHPVSPDLFCCQLCQAAVRFTEIGNLLLQPPDVDVTGAVGVKKSTIWGPRGHEITKLVQITPTTLVMIRMTRVNGVYNLKIKSP